MRKKRLPQGEEPIDYPVEPSRYDIGERIFWWARFWVAVLAVAGFGLGVGRWAITRASTDYVDHSVSALETKENVVKIDKKIESQKQVLGNVRDNLIILMDRQRVKSKPLPDNVLRTPDVDADND